ncbi:MAG: TRAP transporter large permease subunit [Ruminococcaceae bacterium]|nr:TRAP transporter large permease subunit [Oscillospiraceae bacterium]
MNPMILALILFALTYVLMLVFQKYRPIIALTSAVIFIVTGMMPLGEALSNMDSWNVLLMIAGTMGTVALMIESKMPALLADLLIEKVPNVKWAVVMLSLFAGIVSAFIDNVATVLMIAPIALAIAKKFDINPVGMIIAIAVSSNLQGAATLVGDTTSIMLGQAANMDFLDFFVFNGKPGIFFAVELGALISAIILLFLFRKETDKVQPGERTKVTNYVPTVLMLLTVALLIGASVFPSKPAITNGVICCVIMVIGVIYDCIRRKSFKAALDTLKEIDYRTILLLFGLFIVVGGIEAQGVVKAIADVFQKVSGGNLFVVYTIVVWMSVILSAFIDNIPYTATMLPVMASIAANMGADPIVLYFGLLSGATLGGNLTPIGASANITGIGILRKEGYEVKNSDFLKIGIPFTFAAVIPAYIYIWLFYGA